MGHLPGDPMGEAMGQATLVAFDDAMRQALIAATVIAVITATVVSLVVAGRIAGPIATLAHAARRIARGQYAERVPADGPGELGELATSFNDMAGSLEATERRRLQLVGDVAHELRTPLTTLDGYLEGLEDGVVTPSAQTWHLLRAETARLTRMVNELSELWRAEAHQLPLRIDAVDVAEVAPRGGGAVRTAGRRAGHHAGPAGGERRDTRPGAGGPRPAGAGARELPLQRAAPRARRVADHGRRGARPRAGSARPSRTRDRGWSRTSSRRCSSASTGWTRRGAGRRAVPGSGWPSCGRSRRRWAAARGPRATGPGRGATFLLELPAA